MSFELPYTFLDKIDNFYKNSAGIFIECFEFVNQFENCHLDNNEFSNPLSDFFGKFLFSYLVLVGVCVYILLEFSNNQIMSSANKALSILCNLDN